MRVCIVYEVVPDETKLYVVDATEEECVRLRGAHNTFNAWLQDKEPIETIPEDVDMVIVTGFVL